ncbi:complement decay-accelerating factor isoform X2 [Prionailurus bengalensis]|uniref:complement decay-accelerating factor isoform X2 n=1 Tax=Prionailurus bengalensis TaxID=37029 RepID=UPI001CA7ED15|nr:complement decay-accelerating factor isoform X2 [Prionailurus bengalensis]
MGPARRSVPAALRFLGGLSVPLLLLLLLLCPPAAQGDCSLPPEVPNAHPTLSDRDLKSFPEGTAVTYKCNEGFVKVPGKPDSVICLGNNQWSEVAAFCNRSCDVPPRLRFASLKRSFSKQNYFPEGFVVEYDCRPGYRRNQTLSDKLTCLQNFTWSTPDEFCKKKSCPTPGDITHGHVSITTDISYGASISFSCDTGYRLVGSASSYCSLADQAVEWSDPLPKCEEIVCPEPQEISNGTIQNPRKTYVYQQSVKYQCNQGFTLIGENSIYCIVKDDRGEWSGLPPECKENSQISKDMPTVQKPSMASVPSTKVPSAPQKTTTVNVPGTKAPSPPHKATTVNVPATEAPSTPHKPTTVNVPGTGAPSTSQTPTTTNVPGTRVPSAPQKPTTINAPAAKAPSIPQKFNTVNVSATEVLLPPQKSNTTNASATKSPSTPQKPDTINSSAIEALPTPQKPSIVNVSATKAPSTSQKPNTINISATKLPSTPQKPDTLNSSATETLPTSQNPSTVNVSATKAPSTSQKPNTISSSAMEALPTPQKPNTINISATKLPSTPQKPDTLNSSATETLPTSQNPSTVNVSATKAPSTPHKPNTISSSATRALPTPEKPTTVNVPGTKALPTPQKSTKINSSTTKSQPTPQKPTTANDSATAKKFPVSNAVPTETPPAAQKPIVANASATQAIPATRRSTTAKISFTQSVPATQKSTAVHAPVTKGFHTTKRLTSAHITAKQTSAVVPRATTHFRSTSSHKGRGTPSSDANIAAIALITYMKTEKHAIVFRNFTVIGDTSEVKPLVSSKRTHMYNIDSFAYDASNHWLADLAEEEIRRKYTQVCRTFLVS